MTDLNLFSDPIPSTPAAGAASATAAPTCLGTAVAAAGSADDATILDAAVGDPAAAADALPRHLATVRPTRRPAADTDPIASKAVSKDSMEPAAGGPSSGHLLGLLDALVVGLRALGGERLEERLRLVGRCDARLAGVRAETVAALAAP